MPFISLHIYHHKTSRPPDLPLPHVASQSLFTSSILCPFGTSIQLLKPCLCVLWIHSPFLAKSSLSAVSSLPVLFSFLFWWKLGSEVVALFYCHNPEITRPESKLCPCSIMQHPNHSSSLVLLNSGSAACCSKARTPETREITRPESKLCPCSIMQHPNHSSSLVLLNSGSAACCSKARTPETRVGRKGKVALFKRLATWGEGRFMPKSQLSIADQGARALNGEFQGFIGSRGQGGTCQTAQLAPTIILKLVTQWSHQCRIDCFKYS